MNMARAVFFEVRAELHFARVLVLLAVDDREDPEEFDRDARRRALGSPSARDRDAVRS